MYSIWLEDIWMGIHHGFSKYDALERACKHEIQTSYRDVVVEDRDVPDDWDAAEHTSLFSDYFETRDDTYGIHVEGNIEELFDISDGGEEIAKELCEKHNCPWEWMKKTLDEEEKEMEAESHEG